MNETILTLGDLPDFALQLRMCRVESLLRQQRRNLAAMQEMCDMLTDCFTKMKEEVGQAAMNAAPRTGTSDHAIH